MFKFLSGLFDSNEKQIKSAKNIVDQINSFEESFSKMEDHELRARTDYFKKHIAQKIGNQVNISHEDRVALEKRAMEEILPEAFAVIREASKRVAGHRHFDVQLMTGYFLFKNNVTEVFTGEGKTLAANLPLYLYALAGHGAHLVTVNDYLAKRDAEWNGHILNFLGMSVGVVNNDDQYIFIDDEKLFEVKKDSAKDLIEERKKKFEKVGRMKYDHMTGANLMPCSKKEAYGADITYGTSSEFGFDYLRDNMVLKLENQVQRDLYYAIVDEADSILIDEARTPLIISQASQDSNEMYYKFAEIVKNLDREVDYTVDEKAHTVLLTDEGMKKADKQINTENLYSNPIYAYHIDNALKAKELYKLDDEYIIRDGQIYIVDQFTGRVMEGRRYSEGLHQAIEAKERVEVKKESKTVATITLQNYFRLYDFLAGMTGTALTESEEFANIYKLDVVVIPTDKPVIRKDRNDVVYRTNNAKLRAVVEDIENHYKREQPVLVGTTSVEKSELLSELLKKKNIPHNVLNAKQHEKEAKIVAEAGQKGSITIATNMAGRGTDISLGEGVKELGGLYIIGTERHEARRIDNQLRGRSGRQGDPGESQFYVSFDDDLMRIFGGDNMAVLMGRIGMDEDMPVSASLLGKTIETAQKRVESYNFDIRKRLVEYDDVLNQQRNIIYGLRKKLLDLANSKNNNLEIKKDEENSKKFLSKLFKELESFDYMHFLEFLDKFNIRNKESYYDEKVAENFKELVADPASVLVLKKLIEQIRTLLASQLSDDMQIDSNENSLLIRQVKSILSDDLCQVVAKLMKYKDDNDFFRIVDQEKDINKKSDYLLKFTLLGFIFHYYSVSPNIASEISRVLLVQTIDQFWMDHLSTMDDLREGISLRGIANKDPLIEYKNEGFTLFDNMLNEIDSTVVTRFMRVRAVSKEMASKMEKKQELEEVKPEIKIDLKKDEKKQNFTNQERNQQPIKSTQVGRNDPCPCGSGKKYKKCCLGKNK